MGSREDGAIKPSRHPIRVGELEDSGRVAGYCARRLSIGNAQVFNELAGVRSAEDVATKNRVRAATRNSDDQVGHPPLFL
jgi:hypothetical protein